MRKMRLGGSSPFAPTIRPNVFSPLGVEEIIDRQGESVLWYRMQPCPCPPEERLPSCHFCLDGYIKTFQQTVLREMEMVRADGHFLYPRYAPITSVEKLTWLTEGEMRPLSLVRIEDSRIEIKELLPDWAAVQADYNVSVVESAVLETDIDNAMEVFFPDAGGVISGIDHLYLDDQPLEWQGYRFKSISLEGRKTGHIRAHVRIVPPFKLSYRTMDVKNARTDRAGIVGEAGDVEILVPGGFMLGEGDFITFLTTTLRAQHYVKFTPGPIDILMYAPIVKIENVFSKGQRGIVEHKEGTDFIVVSNEKIMWLVDKPQGGFTVMYVYNPTFRVQPGFTGAGVMDRRLPRQYRARPWSSFDIRSQAGTK